MPVITALSVLFLSNRNVQFRCREQMIHVYLSKLACKLNERENYGSVKKSFSSILKLPHGRPRSIEAFRCTETSQMMSWMLDIHLTWCRHSYCMYVSWEVSISGVKMDAVHLCLWTDMRIILHLNRFIHISSREIQCHTISIMIIIRKLCHIATSHILPRPNKIYEYFSTS